MSGWICKKIPRHQLGNVISPNTSGKQKSLPRQRFKEASPFNIKYPEKRATIIKHQDGGPINKQDQLPIKFKNMKTLSEREKVYNRYNPSSGFGLLDYSSLLHASNRSGNKERSLKDHGTYDEEQFFRNYLDLENTLPPMDPKAKTSWDDKIEAAKPEGYKSQFVGLPPGMRERVEAITDTTNLGKIVRNYPAYKKLNPGMENESIYKRTYGFGKQLLESKGRWNQADEGLSLSRIKENGTDLSGLGALQAFGMRWDPKEKTVYMHDTYDFPEKLPGTEFLSWDRTRSDYYVPIRENELKIRDRIPLNPGGSELLSKLKKPY